MRFSDRYGYTKASDAFQIESIDDNLKTRLWNAFFEIFQSAIDNSRIITGTHRAVDLETDIHQITYLYPLFKSLWCDYFKQPIDKMPRTLKDYAEWIKYLVWAKVEWYDIYNLLEFVAQHMGSDAKKTKERFVAECNRVLEAERSAYRFVGDIISRITADEEIAAIEAATQHTGPLTPVSTQLHTALALLSDKQDPKYADSIKNSVGAVETVCKLIAQSPKGTLGQVLNLLAQNHPTLMHTSLNEGFKKLYHWTNDAQGIRHGLMDDQNLDYDDAKYMLVSCSAFVNYLIAKASKAGTIL